MSRLRTFWQSFLDLFRRKPYKWDNPDFVAIESHATDDAASEMRYRSQLRDAFWYAVSRLENAGNFGHRHNVRKLIVLPGTVERPRGWAVFLKESPTSFAGGWSDGYRIWAVANPHTGEILDSTLRHEWGEALLFKAGVKTMEERHGILSRAGL